MKKVSIIMPVYNTDEFIELCIQSVLEQTYNNIEIIVINDNSKDNSKEIIEKFSKIDQRIKLINFNERKGVGAARNHGIKKATGKFIYFLDSDDYLPPETINLLVSNVGNNEIIRGRMRATRLSNSFSIIFNGLFNPKIFSETKYNLIRNNSATNFLISKEYITRNKLSFSEDVEIYSDLYFMLPALIATENVLYIREAIYFKRRRNDPIANPSLTQYNEEVKINELLQVYLELKEMYTDPQANAFLDKHLLNFYRKDIILYFQETNNIEEHFDQLHTVMNKVDLNSLKEHNVFLKREIRAIRKNKQKGYKRIHWTHHLLRDIRDVKKSKSLLYRLLYKRVFSKLPIKNKLVFFESFLGKSYSDSPKYIYEYLIENYKDYKFVWSFTDKTDIPGNAKQVKRFSMSYFYYLARSKYWVSNSRLPKYLTKREGNIYLQTWHGTPLKTLVFDMDEIYSADPNYKNNFYIQSRRWDYLNSPNEYSSEIFKKAFKYEKPMLEFGYPRNDVLYNQNTSTHIKSLKQKMNIPKDKKIILYAPTWRDDDYFSRGKYRFELELDLKEMQKELGEEYLIILRMHYFIANKMDISSFEGFAFDFSTYDDIAELYLVSDILITDYSSVFFDYANLKRPILFFTYDLEKYRDKLRGFYLDIETEVPGPLLMSSEEVIQSVKNIKQLEEDYKDLYDNFYNKFCKWDDGNAAKKTVKAVFK